MSKSREQKRIARRKRIRKETNLRRNNSSSWKFALQVLHDGKWTGQRTFVCPHEVREYVAEVDVLRLRGDTEILAGRIWDRRKEKYVCVIEAYKPESTGPSMVDAAKLYDEKDSQ